MYTKLGVLNTTAKTDNSFFSKTDIEKILKDIYDGKIDKGTIPEQLYAGTYKALSSAIDLGFGSIDYKTHDPELVYELKNNVATFSAFKSHVQQSDYHNLLVDESGKQRSWASFRKEALKVDSTYNQQWLSAEYNLATRQARSAKQWNQFEAKKDIYPNLQYMPSRSAKQRDLHRQYYGRIFSIDDPIWNTIMPPNGWGCKCWVQQTRERVTDNSGIEPLLEVPGIAGNSGKTGTIFNASHPYVSKTGKTDKEAIRKQLNNLKELNKEFLSVKVGKNTLQISTLADRTDLNDNIEFITPFMLKYKEDFGIREHSKIKSIKNPEYSYSDYKGDLTKYEGQDIKNFASRGFRKCSKGKQLGDEKECFLAFDFIGEISDLNIYDVASQFNSKLNYYRTKEDGRVRVNYILIKNGDKLSKIVNIEGLGTKAILQQMKKELL